MNTTTTTTRHGRETATTTTTIITPREYHGIEIDRVIEEVRTYDGEHSGTYRHASNGTQFTFIDSTTYNTLISK